MWIRRGVVVLSQHFFGLSRKVVRMAESRAHSAAFVTCPNSEVAKALARFVV